MERTPEIQRLDEKKIRVRYPDGGEGDRSIWVQKADPNGREVGKCAVALCHSIFPRERGKEAESFAEMKTENGSFSSNEFLTPEAIKLIRDDEDFPNKLFLDLA